MTTLTTITTALAALWAGLRQHPSAPETTPPALSPPVSEPVPEPVSEPVAVTTAPTRPVRVPPKASRSLRVRCHKPTAGGTPCGKWVLLIDSTTYASGCWWHSTKVELLAWHATRQGQATA